MENETKKSRSHIKDLIDKINKFLDKEKNADILIIKAHLLSEYYVNQLLILRERCSHKDLEELTFYEKIIKALNLENKDEKLTFDYLIKLNKLRNKVGHELEYSLSESDIDALGYVQGKKYILDKYDHESDTERLRSILSTIVINIALHLINGIEDEKKINEKS